MTTTTTLADTAWLAARAAIDASFAAEAPTWNGGAGYIGEDAVGRPDDDFERWAAAQINGAVYVAAYQGGYDDTDAVIEKRVTALTDAMCTLIMSHSVGAIITVHAVITVARTAFAMAPDEDTLRAIGIAGMTVMHIHAPVWSAAHANGFGDALALVADVYCTIRRPRWVAEDHDMLYGTRQHAENAAINGPKWVNPFADLGAMFTAPTTPPLTAPLTP